MRPLEDLVDFYENISAADLARFGAFYSDVAYFKDPFNEVRGIDAIRGVFAHMFSTLHEPRFVVTDRLLGDTGAMLTWEFSFRRESGAQPLIIRGASHLRFDASGRVNYQRDYWDAAEELYSKLPLVGCFMRFLRRRVAAAPG